MNLCKTRHCTRNAVPEGFGYCNVCFTRIMEVRKVRALEKIAEELAMINISGTNLTQTNRQQFTQTVIKKKDLKKEDSDFIPNIDIKDVQTSGVKVETKKDRKNISKIRERLKNII